MERLPQELGQEVAAQLADNDITTVHTFLMLSQEMVMSTLQMKLGSWLRIQRLQQEFRESGILSETTSASLNNSDQSLLDPSIDKDAVIKVLESSSECQKLLRGKLAEGATLLKKEKHKINRTLCDHFFANEINAGRSITSATKRKLAQSIITAFDCLACNSEEKPAEAEFFWEHNGQTTGEHTGFIHFWVRNKQAQAPPTVRKKRKSFVNLSREVSEAVDELMELDETADFTTVEQLMESTFHYRDGLRNRKVQCNELLTQFPHFIFYEGQLIHYEFEMMFPDKEATRLFSTIVPLCLVLNQFYDEIASVGVKALLKIMAELTHQGNVRKSNPSNLPPLEDFASVFVRWKQDPEDEMEGSEVPFIFCDTVAFAEGAYFVVLEKGAIACGTDFFIALDLLLKAMKVLNISVPSKAKKTVDFFYVFVYKILKHSRVARVNDLCDHLSKAADALP
nr:uncharacterized protein LOC115254442 isoform X2 [Aedes albopictus]